MIPMLLNLGAGELVMITVLAVFLFGPEKLPVLIKKASRVLRFLRDVANSATDELKSELGPEFADLTPADLHPARLVQRTVLRDVQTDLVGVKTQIEGLRAELDEKLTSVKTEDIMPIRDDLAGIGRNIDADLRDGEIRNEVLPSAG